MGKISRLLQHSVVKNGMWLMVLQGFNTILPFLTIPYITRILSASYFGDFSLGLNWVGYLQILVEYGFVLSGTKKMAILTRGGDQEEQNKLYSRIIYSRMLLAMVSLIVLVVLLLILRFNFRVKVCMAILFLMVVGVVFQHNWFFQGKEDMKYITLGNAIGRTVSTILIFILVKKADDIYLYCILYSLNFLLMAGFGFILARIKYKTKLIKCSFKEVLDELKDGWYVFLSSAMTKVFSGFGVTYLGFFVSTRLIGIYSAIYKVPYLLILLWSPISQALYPYNSRKYVESFSSGIASVKKSAAYLITGFSLVGIGLIVANKFVVGFLFGAEYVGYSYILIPLIVWVLLGIINNLLGIQILVASGHEKEYSKEFSISIIVSIIATVVLGYRYDILGISLAMMLAELILFALLWKSVSKIEKRSHSL